MSALAFFLYYRATDGSLMSALAFVYFMHSIHRQALHILFQVFQAMGIVHSEIVQPKIYPNIQAAHQRVKRDVLKVIDTDAACYMQVQCFVRII